MIEAKLSEVYRRAANRVRKGWCQNAFAVTSDGREVSWEKPEAHSYCALGAIFVESNPENIDEQRHVALPLMTALVLCGEIKIYDEENDERRAFEEGDDLASSLLGVEAGEDVGAWNDKDCRTAAVVADQLDCVAATLESEGR